MGISLQADQASRTGHLQTHQATVGAASLPWLVASSAQHWPLWPRHSGWTQDTVIAIKAILPEFGAFSLQKQVDQEGWVLEKQPGVWAWEGIRAQLFPGRCPGSGRRRQNQG